MAQDEDGLIGIGNKLPWHLPEELAFFKDLTNNGTLLMGRKTSNSEQNISLCCRKVNKTSKKEIFSFEELTKKQIEERLKND